MITQFAWRELMHWVELLSLLKELLDLVLKLYAFFA